MHTPIGTPARWLGLAALGLAAGTFAPDAEAQRNVTLRLNTASIPDTVDVNDFVEVRGAVGGNAPATLPDGNVIDWNASSTLEPVNIGGDYWEVSFQIPNDQEMQFKFWNGEDQDTPLADWEDGSNWSIPAGSADYDGGLHYFNKTGGDVAYDWRPFAPSGADSVAVWFRVYALTEELNLQDYDPNDPNFDVGLRGDGALGGTQNGQVIDWGASNIDLRREGEGVGNPATYIYSGRVAYPNSAIGQQQLYKFVAQSQDGTAPVGWEQPNDTGFPDGNRGFTVPAQDTTLHLVFFGDEPPVNDPPVTQPVVFQVDAQPLADVGVFSRSRGDSLQVRGGFNGWGCANPDNCQLVRQGGTEIYRRGVPFTAVDGANFIYKYFVDLNLEEGFDGLDEGQINDFGYEEPLDTGGSDRSFNFDGTAPNLLGPEFFNAIRPGNVISSAEGTVNVSFEVDMRNATGFAGDPFVPAEDGVYVQFEDKVWQLTQGFTPDEIVNDPFNFELSDPNGDLIYTGTYALQTPTYNGIGYRYVYGNDETNELVYDGQGGFGPGRRRYRYVIANNGDFPSSFQFARDVFRPDDELTPYEANPTDPNRGDRIDGVLVIENGVADPAAVAIEEAPGEVAEATQAVAFPNPVAGTATIRYDVPQAGAVSLRVYDLVGREVAVLVNEEQAAAKYDATFEASDLAPGVYVYRLQAAGQVVSGKLTVVR